MSGEPVATGRPRRFRRGAAILPSLFTVGNLFLGYWAIILALKGQVEVAAPLIGWAIALDALDGRIARMTGTTSEFGGELDSLADSISFGVAPAVLVYQWGLSSLDRIGWLASFLLVMCGTLRLARFNVQRQVVDSRFFVGLPIPAAAAQVATVVYMLPLGPPGERGGSLLAAVAVVMLAFLMVSTLRYRSFKGIDLKQRRSYLVVLGIAILFFLIALHPKAVLLSVATLYTLSGPSGQLVTWSRRRGLTTPAAAPAAVPAPAPDPEA